MRWKFWEKKSAREPKFHRLPSSPSPLPEKLRQHLIQEFELSAEWVGSLSAVTRPMAGEHDIYEFRVFSPTQMALRGITVRDYSSLEGCGHLILFSGTLNLETGVVSLIPGVQGRAS
jgi:hypothetical protein